VRRSLLFTVLILLEGVCGDAGASVGDWRSYSRLVIHRIAAGPDAVWAATEGGIIRSSLVDGSARTYSPSDGLPDRSILSVIVDSAGTAWFGTGEGGILRFTKRKNLSLPVLEPALLSGQVSRVVALFLWQNRLYVGHSTGVTVLDRGTNRVVENYHQLGGSSDLRNQAVSALAVVGGRIYAGTARGLSWAELDGNPLLPDSWTSIEDSFTGVSSITSFHGNVYVATVNGVRVETASGWVLTGPAAPVYDLAVYDGALWMASSRGLLRTTDGVNWEAVAGLTSPVKALAPLEGVALIAAGEAGTYRVQGATPEVTKMPGVDFPPTNAFTNIVLDTAGAVWVAPGPARGAAQYGIFRFRDNTWVHLPPAQNGMPSPPAGEPDGGFISIVVDGENRVWAGTWGGGIGIVSSGGTTALHAETVNTANSPLTGLDGSPDYLVTKAFHRGADGVMYAGIWHSGVFALSPGFSPGTGTAYQIMRKFMENGTISRTLNVTALTLDRYSVLWVGTSSAGVLLIDTNNTPFDGSDDQFVGTLGRQGIDSDVGLRSRNVRSIARAPNGDIWVATDAGLTLFQGEFARASNRYSLTTRHFTLDDGLASNSLNAVLVDSFDVVWVGTDRGLAQVLPTKQVITLPVERIVDTEGKVTSLAFDRARGYLWIGTPSGLTRYEAYPPVGAGDSIIAEPSQNPFMIGISQRGSDYVLTGTPLSVVVTPGATVRIYTITGDLVWETTDSGIGQVTWDGRTWSPARAVASGVYLYIAQKGSNTATGKIAVLRDAR